MVCMHVYACVCMHVYACICMYTYTKTKRELNSTHTRELCVCVCVPLYCIELTCVWCLEMKYTHVSSIQYNGTRTHTHTHTFMHKCMHAWKQDNSHIQVGDVNLFFYEEDEPHTCEINIMIAEESQRRKGYAREAARYCLYVYTDTCEINVMIAEESQRRRGHA